MKIGPAFLLFLVFFVCKVTGYLDWSWWWITSPLWVPFALFTVSVVIVTIARLLETPQQRAARMARELARKYRV